MDHDEIGCQAPNRPTLCINNCGFFGHVATRNMCSKCHRETVLKDEKARFAASFIENIVNGTSNKGKDAVVAVAASVDVKSGGVETKDIYVQVSSDSGIGQPSEAKKADPRRCLTFRKRVGLTGFSCRCGNLFCAAHRYSDKHDCPFDYQSAAQNAIAKANLVVKADKLDKI